MKPFLLLLASAIALGIHAQGARDWLALRAELDAAYESFQQAVVARNPLAGTSGRNVLVLAQSLHGVDHSETAKLAYSVASALRPANGWETSESDAYAIVEPLVQVMTPMAQMIYSDGRVFRTLPAHVRRIYSRRRSFEQLSALVAVTEEIAKASDNPGLLADLYLNISKYPLERSEHFATEAVRLTSALYGPRDARTLVASINAGEFQKSRNQARYYEQILALGKDVEDFGDQLFGLHRTLAILYIKSGDEMKATEHLQAAGSIDARTLVASINAGQFQELGNQAQYYEQILALGKDVEDFGDQLFGLHRTLAILYIKSGDETKATEHLQAAGFLKNDHVYSRDDKYAALVKVPAKYPRTAARRGIEGLVWVEFTVTRKGTVHSTKVLESKPPGVFDQAAMEAVQQFRYLPQYVNGEPVEVQGVSQFMQFDLSD